MEIIFECEDKTGARLYEEIIKDALRLHATFLKKMYVFVDVKEPLFIIHVSWMKKPKIVLREMATIEANQEGVKIELGEEHKHRVSELFNILKSVYGEEYVDEREYSIIVKDAKPQDLENFVVDFDEKTINAIVDMLMRIIPEGFRVVQVLSSQDGLTLISSENPIKTEWVEKANQIASSGL